MFDGRVTPGSTGRSRIRTDHRAFAQARCTRWRFLALTAAGCGGDDDDSSSRAPAEPGAQSNEQFEADGIDLTFEYPEDLQARDEIEFSRSAGSAATATGGVGIDETNVIAVQRFDLETEVTKDNLNRVKREADTLFSQLAGDRADGERTTIAGLPRLTAVKIDLEEPADAFDPRDRDLRR